MTPDTLYPGTHQPRAGMIKARENTCRIIHDAHPGQWMGYFKRIKTATQHTGNLINQYILHSPRLTWIMMDCPEPYGCKTGAIAAKKPENQAQSPEQLPEMVTASRYLHLLQQNTCPAACFRIHLPGHKHLHKNRPSLTVPCCYPVYPSPFRQLYRQYHKASA